MNDKISFRDLWATADKPVSDMTKSTNYKLYYESSTSDEDSDTDSGESCVSFKAVPEEFRPNLDSSNSTKKKSGQTSFISNPSTSGLYTRTCVPENTKALHPNNKVSEHADVMKQQTVLLNESSSKPQNFTKKNANYGNSSGCENYRVQSNIEPKAAISQNHKNVVSKEIQAKSVQELSKTDNKSTVLKSETTKSNLPKLQITGSKIKKSIKYEHIYMSEQNVAEVKRIEIDVSKLTLNYDHSNQTAKAKQGSRPKTYKFTKQKFRPRMKRNNVAFQQTLEQVNFAMKPNKPVKSPNALSLEENKLDHLAQHSLAISRSTFPKNNNKVEWAVIKENMTTEGEEKAVQWQIRNECSADNFNLNFGKKTKITNLSLDDPISIRSNNNSNGNYALTVDTHAACIQHSNHAVQQSKRILQDSQMISHKNHKLCSKCTNEHARQVCYNAQSDSVNIIGISPTKNVSDKNIYRSSNKTMQCQCCGVNDQMKFHSTENFFEINSQQNTMLDTWKSRHEISNASEKRNLILQKIKEISDHVVGGHIALTSLFLFYHEWITFRKKVIDQFQVLANDIENSSKYSKFNANLFDNVQAGAVMVSGIPHPHISLAGKLVAVFSAVAKKIFTPQKKINIDDLEIITSLVREKDASAALYMYGLQCNQQFTETVKLIEEFHSDDRIHNFYDSNNEDVTTFMMEFLESNPKHNTFYKKLQKCFEGLSEQHSPLSKKICEPFSLYSLKAMDVIGILDWRFNIEDFSSESVQYQLEQISNLIQNKNFKDQSNVKELGRKMKICVSILEDELIIVERCVSKISALDCAFHSPLKKL